MNRPSRHNALSFEVFTGLASAASTLAADKSVRAAILRGEGKSFCSGLDVTEMAKNPTNGARLLAKPGGTEHSNLAQDVSYLWRSCPFPVIASLHGKCWGGGLQIASGCDFRYSSPDCTFSIMEIKWGLVPDMGGTVTWRDAVRHDHLLELAMTGRIVSAKEAQELGLVTRVAEDPYKEAVKVAEDIATKSPDAIALIKDMFNKTRHCSEANALNMETAYQKRLMPSWNQFAASAKNFGVGVPYCEKSKHEPSVPTPPPKTEA